MNHTPPTFTELNPPEESRTYHFPDSQEVTFRNVVRIAVSERGTHRLETAEGDKLIIPPTWLYISISVKEWTL